MDKPFDDKPFDDKPFDEKPLDKNRDRMILALMGELSKDEYDAFLVEIEGDEDLLRDWHEISAARSFLGDALGERENGDFVFELPQDQALKSRIETVKHLVLRRLYGAGLGFAAATVVFCVLLFGGLRIDRSPNGILVGFGLPNEAQSQEQLLEGVVTRAELERALVAVVDVTSNRLDDLERSQTDKQAYYSRALYDALAESQERHYDDIRTQIEFASWSVNERQGVFDRSRGD